MCVMAGVPFMQIAAWLGHHDGGILVGKVYGHLWDEFGGRMARQVVFTSVAAGSPCVTERSLTNARAHR